MLKRFQVVAFCLAAVSPLFGQQAAPSSHRTLLNRYCVTCHNDRARTAGLSLEKIDVDRVTETAKDGYPGANAVAAGDTETWEKVLRKLRAGAMPPSGAPRPD